MSTDESILGLLLRAHRRVCEQKHGEEYVHRNMSSMAHFENAAISIESAIKSVSLADGYVLASELNGTKQKKLGE